MVGDDLIEFDGSGGIYLEILWGLAGAGGGVEAEGKFYRRLPDMMRRIKLYGGAYFKASALWGLWSKKWTYGIEWDSGWESDSLALDFNGESFLSNITDSKSITICNMDLPCLKDFSDGYAPISDPGVGTVVSGNVGVSAVPKVVVMGDGSAVVVWSDINLTGDGGSFQSDIFWSVYDGGVWGTVESTDTVGRCEFDPELIVVDDGVSEYAVLTFLAVDSVINESTVSSDFYAGARIHTGFWNVDSGWSFNGENLIVSGGTINSRCLSSDINGNIYLSYLLDSDCDPWETGIGKIFMVNGTVLDDLVDWSNPVLIKEFDDFDMDLKPCVSFVDEYVGGVVYSLFNSSSDLNETFIVPTVSGIGGFSDEVLINSTNLSLSYVSSVEVNDDIVVFWVENSSRIVRCRIITDPDLGSWVFDDAEVVFESFSVVSLKPVVFDDKNYLLFQSGEDFVPFVLEKLVNDSWGNLRQVSLGESFSLGQVDGDST